MTNTGQNIAIGCGALIVALVVGLMCLNQMAQPPEDVQIHVEAPLEVERGTRFTIVARVRNDADRPQTLVDLDVADEYLDGIVIESSNPPFSDAMHVPIDNTVSYSFDLDIAAGDEVAVTFNAYAPHVGDYQGDIDFCINGAASCSSYPVRTIVR